MQKPEYKPIMIRNSAGQLFDIWLEPGTQPEVSVIDTDNNELSFALNGADVSAIQRACQMWQASQSRVSA